MACSTKPLSYSVLGSPLEVGHQIPSPLVGPLLVRDMSQVSCVYVGRSRELYSHGLLQLSPSRLGQRPSPLGASPACGSCHSILLAQKSEFPLWVGKAVLRLPPPPRAPSPTCILAVSLHGHTTPDPSLRHLFPAEPGAPGEPGEQTQQIAERGSAAPFPPRAATVSRPVPAAQTPARLAPRAGRPLRCSSQASRAPTVRVPARGPLQEARQRAARLGTRLRAGVGKPGSRGSQYFPASRAARGNAAGCQGPNLVHL